MAQRARRQEDHGHRPQQRFITLLYHKEMRLALSLLCIVLFASCGKKNSPPATPGQFTLSFTVNGSNNGTLAYTTSTMSPVIRFSFSSPIQAGSLNSNVSFLSSGSAGVTFSSTLLNGDSVLI